LELFSLDDVGPVLRPFSARRRNEAAIGVNALRPPIKRRGGTSFYFELGHPRGFMVEYGWGVGASSDVDSLEN